MSRVTRTQVVPKRFRQLLASRADQLLAAVDAAVFALPLWRVLAPIDTPVRLPPASEASQVGVVSQDGASVTVDLGALFSGRVVAFCNDYQASTSWAASVYLALLRRDGTATPRTTLASLFQRVTVTVHDAVIALDAASGPDGALFNGTVRAASDAAQPGLRSMVTTLTDSHPSWAHKSTVRLFGVPDGWLPAASSLAVSGLSLGRLAHGHLPQLDLYTHWLGRDGDTSFPLVLESFKKYFDEVSEPWTWARWRRWRWCPWCWLRWQRAAMGLWHGLTHRACERVDCCSERGDQVVSDMLQSMAPACLSNAHCPSAQPLCNFRTRSDPPPGETRGWHCVSACPNHTWPHLRGLGCVPVTMHGQPCASHAVCGSGWCSKSGAGSKWGQCAAPMATGASCSANRQCASGWCGADGACRAKLSNGDKCSDSGHSACASGYCNDGTCASRLAAGAACSGPARSRACSTGYCSAGSSTCATRSSAGASCTAHVECASDWCRSGACAKKLAVGTACEADAQCASALCEGGVCSVTSQ